MIKKSSSSKPISLISQLQTPNSHHTSPISHPTTPISKKVIIFDFDGTLVDTFEIAFKCMNKLAPKYKFKLLNEKELIKLRDKSFKDIIKEDLKLKWYQLPFFIRDIQKIMKEEIKTVKFHKDLIPVLKTLSKTHQLFILSSNHKEIIKLELEKNNLDVFKAVYSGSSLFKKEKSILKLIKMFNLVKEDCIYVGDETRDIEACKIIYVKIISVSWGFNSREILFKHNPDYLIDKPKELLKIKGLRDKEFKR